MMKSWMDPITVNIFYPPKDAPTANPGVGQTKYLMGDIIYKILQKLWGDPWRYPVVVDKRGKLPARTPSTPRTINLGTLPPARASRHPRRGKMVI